MQLFYPFLLVCFFLFLFCLYALSFDDFVMIRKKVPTEQVFNIAFLVLIVGVLSARVLYVITHFTNGFLNPFVFFLFPYFPGLSLIGGIVGAAIFLALFLRSKRLPTGRIFDIFSLSLLWILPLGYVFLLVTDVFQRKHPGVMEGVDTVVYIIFSLLFFFLIAPYQRRGELKDGSTALLFLCTFLLLSFVSSTVEPFPKISATFSIEGIVALVASIVSLILFLKQERFFLFQKRTQK